MLNNEQISSREKDGFQKPREGQKEPSPQVRDFVETFTKSSSFIKKKRSTTKKILIILGIALILRGHILMLSEKS